MATCSLFILSPSLVLLSSSCCVCSSLCSHLFLSSLPLSPSPSLSPSLFSSLSLCFLLLPSLPLFTSLSLSLSLSLFLLTLPVLAGIAGAMPFVGAYWVALPAVLELWLVQGQLLTALSVMGLSLLPLFFVDTIINREIEG